MPTALFLLIWALGSTPCHAFGVVKGKARSLQTALHVSTVSDSSKGETLSKSELCQKVEECIAQNQNPRVWLDQFDDLPDNLGEPNRQEAFLGQWHVWWTDCPPPSNGQLGPFQGTAEQFVEDSTTGSYQNILRVPPNDWLTAVLDGVWEDWDGVLLPRDEEKKTQNKDSPAPTTSTSQQQLDYGANHWKVTFLKLQIKLLGIPLLNKDFPPETSRVWRTTYLSKVSSDNEAIRVVRAGQTGRVEDEYVFYTKRTPPPLL